MRSTNQWFVWNSNVLVSLKIVLVIFIFHHKIFIVTGRNSSHGKKTLDVDLKPDPGVIGVDLQSDLMTNNTSPNNTDNSEQAPSEIDEEWVTDAIKDVAYYLRSHKFNDFDRRYLPDEHDAGTIFFEEFPEPPLRAIHWETHKHCETSFLDCLKFLHEKVLQTDLKRTDDTITIKREKGWTAGNNAKEIEEADAQCKKLFDQERTQAKPFLGPLERFQWRTSASYYMCWFTMKQTPQLTLFGEPCDNFANCLDPTLGESNRDPRADDRLPFQCAAYSFCPDPCCPKKHIALLDECWNNPVNPCYNEAPKDNRKCVFNSKSNTDFKSLVANKWNTTCICSKGGFEWSSRFGICIDVDECLLKTDTCQHSEEACFNLPGSFACGCKWGYRYDSAEGKCTLDDALVRSGQAMEEDDADTLKPVSLVQLLKKMRKKNDGTKTSENVSILLDCLLLLLFVKYIMH